MFRWEEIDWIEVMDVLNERLAQLLGLDLTPESLGRLKEILFVLYDVLESWTKIMAVKVAEKFQREGEDLPLYEAFSHEFFERNRREFEEAWALLEDAVRRGDRAQMRVNLAKILDAYSTFIQNDVHLVHLITPKGEKLPPLWSWLRLLRSVFDRLLGGGGKGEPGGGIRETSPLDFRSEGEEKSL